MQSISHAISKLEKVYRTSGLIRRVQIQPQINEVGTMLRSLTEVVDRDTLELEFKDLEKKQKEQKIQKSA